MNVLAVMPDSDRVQKLAHLLSHQDVRIHSSKSLSAGLALAKDIRPDCVLLDGAPTAQHLRKFRNQLAAWAPDCTAPVLVVEESDEWRAIVDSVTRVRQAVALSSQESRPQSRGETPGKAFAGTLLLIDESDFFRKQLAGEFAKANWHVYETSDVRHAAVVLLDAGIDCLLLRPVAARRADYSLIRSTSIIRRAHPHPYSIIAIVTEAAPKNLAEARRNGADDVVSLTLDKAILVHRVSQAVLIRRLQLENRSLKEQLARGELAAPPPGAESSGVAPPALDQPLSEFSWD